jgi:hypothetical protein
MLAGMAAWPALTQEGTRPVRINPALVRATPTPTPTPSASPTPIRIGRPLVVATPTPAPVATPLIVRPGYRPRPGFTPTPAPTPVAGRPTPVGRPTPPPGPVVVRPTPGPIIVRPTPVATPLPPKPVGPVPPVVAQGWDGSPTLIVPPGGLALNTRPGAVTLRPGSYADIAKTLPQIRQLPVASLRANPRVTIGKTKVDFRPMLQNPRALANIANQLRRMPAMVEVRGDVLEAVEIKQGLVIRSVLTYNFKPGACSTPQKRAQIAGAGVNCFTSATQAQRRAAFATPGDPHYVKNPTERQRALAQADAAYGQMLADVQKSVADFRAQANSPQGRATLVASIGQEELNRLVGLDDQALAGELTNASESKIEQVAFIPNAASLASIADAKIVGKVPLSTAPFGVLAGGDTPPPPAPPAPPPAPVTVTNSYSLPEYTFLAGFTLGKEYEWRIRVETTIKWCLVGCKKTYYAEAYAGFNYGFGLRFPLKFSGDYTISQTGSAGTASVTTKITPFNGGPSDYGASGLQNAKWFEGKEFVAQIGAHAGLSAKLPIVGHLGADLAVGFDFTDGLPAPFTDGQFTPPTPGQPGPGMTKVFEDFDLIGGRANFGVLGAQVFPAVKVTMESGLLTMDLRDLVNGGPPTKINQGPMTTPLGFDATGGFSKFVIENPQYNVSMHVTPGLTARLFIDLAVWGTHWDWPVWFPQLEVVLPPGGYTFACHAGTVCSREVRMTAKGEQSQFVADLEAWGKGFEAEWTPKCQDEPCKLGIRFVRAGMVLWGKKQYDGAIILMDKANPPDRAVADAQSQANIMADVRKLAIKDAQGVVQESWNRKTAKAAEAWAILYQAVWSKRCDDKICYDNVTNLTKEMPPRAYAVAKANPDMSGLAVQGQVGKEFLPRFQAEIDASKKRTAVEEALEVQRRLRWSKRMTMPRQR